MSKPTFIFASKLRKKNVTIAIHSGPAGKAPKYVGTLTFDDQEAAAALLSAVQGIKASNAEFTVARG
jgi:hypothetical protein